ARPVLAVAAGAARRLRDQALTLVVADGVDGHAGLACELTDIHGDLPRQGVMVNPWPWSRVKGLSPTCPHAAVRPSPPVTRREGAASRPAALQNQRRTPATQPCSLASPPAASTRSAVSPNRRVHANPT